jgi:hypothetical protein
MANSVDYVPGMSREWVGGVSFRSERNARDLRRSGHAAHSAKRRGERRGVSRLPQRCGHGGAQTRVEGTLQRLTRLPAVANSYVVEKLVVAVESVAVSAAPIQQRVRNAWMGALVHLRPDDFEDPR